MCCTFVLNLLFLHFFRFTDTRQIMFIVLSVKQHNKTHHFKCSFINFNGLQYPMFCTKDAIFPKDITCSILIFNLQQFKQEMQRGSFETLLVLKWQYNGLQFAVFCCVRLLQVHCIFISLIWLQPFYLTCSFDSVLFKTIVFSECLLHLVVIRVFVLLCVLVFVRAILPWCP